MIPTDILTRIKTVPNSRHRRVIAIAGPPASGKSTFAAEVVEHLDDAHVLPMDGFHLDNDTLNARGMLHRKGAPRTFNGAGFVALVRRLQTPGDLRVPLFDRAHDRVIPDAATIPADCRTVIVEGNYLLLEKAPWTSLRPEWDLSVYLDVPIEILRQRLVRRWLDHGFNHEDAVKKAESNDIPNAENVVQNGFEADLICTNWGKSLDLDL